MIQTNQQVYHDQMFPTRSLSNHPKGCHVLRNHWMHWDLPFFKLGGRPGLVYQPQTQCALPSSSSTGVTSPLALTDVTSEPQPMMVDTSAGDDESESDKENVLNQNVVNPFNMLALAIPSKAGNRPAVAAAKPTPKSKSHRQQQHYQSKHLQQRQRHRQQSQQALKNAKVNRMTMSLSNKHPRL